MQPAGKLSNYVPDEIRQMRKLAESFSFYRQSAEKRFYDQAVMMAAYEDDFAYTGQFVRYFPTYETMDTRQLRGYFTWRTNVRRGDVQPCPLSFVYVYVYELLNRVCGESPEEGYEKLRAFWQTYRVFEPGLDRYLRVWLRDYVVYYGLDKSLLHGLTDTEYDDALLALQNGSEAERFDALVRLSAYRTENSGFSRKTPTTSAPWPAAHTTRSRPTAKRIGKRACLKGASGRSAPVPTIRSNRRSFTTRSATRTTPTS